LRNVEDTSLHWSFLKHSPFLKLPSFFKSAWLRFVYLPINVSEHNV